MVFKRLGFLALVVPYGLGILAQLTIAEDGLSAGLGYITGAILIYFLGKYLNRDYKLDKERQKSILDKIDSKHSFFYVRMEYWPILWIIVGVLVIVPNSDYAFDKFLQFFGFGLLIIAILALIRLFKRFTEKYDEKTSLFGKESIQSNQDKSKINNIVNVKESIRNIKNTEVKAPQFKPSDHDQYKPK